ncbi:PP2C family protein-serine/threonine phosphatase [Patescibacteria group bacterium]
MLTFLRKTVTRRISIFMIVVAIVLGVATYLLWTNPMSFPLTYTLIGAGMLVVLFIAITFNVVGRPLKKVTTQMKYLLTGRPYKRIYSNRVDEIGVMAQFFNEITDNIETISSKLKEQERMSSELEIASSIQRKILPLESPQIPGLEIVAKNRSAAEVGGDSFDFINRPDSTFMYVGDVTGHGAPAALVMMMVNTLLYTYSEMYDNLYDIVVNTNRQLKPRIKSAMFMTMVMMKWDHKTQKMTYVGAGHEYLLVYRAATGKVEAQAAGGIALGMVPDNGKLIKEQEVKLEKDDVILLYTDGITEAKNNQGEMFEIDRLKESFAKHAAQYGPEGISHHIATDYSNYVGDTEQADDVTLMVMKYTGTTDEQAKPADKSTKW